MLRPKGETMGFPLGAPPAPTGLGVADTLLRPGKDMPKGDDLPLDNPLFLAGSPETGRPGTFATGL